jgi:hypothetical protein
MYRCHQTRNAAGLLARVLIQRDAVVVAVEGVGSSREDADEGVAGGLE